MIPIHICANVGHPYRFTVNVTGTCYTRNLFRGFAAPSIF